MLLALVKEAAVFRVKLLQECPHSYASIPADSQRSNSSVAELIRSINEMMCVGDAACDVAAPNVPTDEAAGFTCSVEENEDPYLSLLLAISERRLFSSLDL